MKNELHNNNGSLFREKIFGSRQTNVFGENFRAKSPGAETAKTKFEKKGNVVISHERTSGPFQNRHICSGVTFTPYPLFFFCCKSQKI